MSVPNISKQQKRVAQLQREKFSAESKTPDAERMQILLVNSEMLIAAIRCIIENWASGDLAWAVNAARETADMAEDFIVNQCGK